MIIRKSLLSLVAVFSLPMVAGAAEPAQVVTGDRVTTYVNVRAGPTADSEVIGELAAGVPATFVSERGRWYEIEMPDGGTGFVHSYWTDRLGDAPVHAAQAPVVQPESEPESAYTTQVITADSVTNYVNVRAGPTADSEVIGALAAGAHANFISAHGRWYEIETSDGVSGFVHSYWTEKVSAVARQGDTQLLAADAPDAEDEPPKRDRTPLIEPARLLKEGRGEDAYALLSKLEVEWAGDTGFDYLLGVAALDSGHPGEAIFALERVVKLLPKFTGARMELARALFDIGDHDLAEKEFVKLLDKEPPEEVRNIIMAFLDIIRNPPVTAEPPKKLFYAMASGGYDSNANGAADINEFLGFALDSRSTEQDSPFAEAALGGIMKRPLKPGLDLLFGADAKHRHNRDAEYVDNTYASSTVGLAITKGDHGFNLGLGATWSAIDGSFNERGLALDLGWTSPLQNDKALRVTMRAGPVRYTDALKARDLDRLNYSITMRRPVQDGAGDFDVTLIGGRDLAKDRNTPYSNSRAGGRVGGRLQVGGKDLFWGLGALRVPYNGLDFFGTDRKDKQYTANLAIEIVDKPLK
ncbi:MAG: SH3 domain-containing protein, partial [Gammaproteobacteria bacterium]|nr:SH3 domain-containing protein [Gammaproteobacteria bacterium]